MDIQPPFYLVFLLFGWLVTLTSFLLLKKHSRFILLFDQIVELVFKFEPTIDPALLTMT